MHLSAMILISLWLGSPAPAPVIINIEEANLSQDPPAAKETPKEEFERRFAAIVKTDAKGFLDLASWAEKAGLATEAKKAFRAVIEADPDNDVARTKLGFVKVNGEWITKEKAAEIEKAKGGDPKKKGTPATPKAPGGAYKDILANATEDAAIAKALGKVVGDVPTVASSEHFSLRGAISREQAKDVLLTAEQAYSELGVIFELDPEVSVFGIQKLTIYFAKDEAEVKELLPFIQDHHGKLDPYLIDDIKKNGGGMAANAGTRVSITRADVDHKSYVLHQLGQVYIQCLCNGSDPWLSEGFAIYTAVRWAGNNSTYCHNVSSYSGSVGKAKKGEDTSFGLICKEIAQDKSDTPIESLQKKKLDQLDDRDLAKSFSLVKMFIEKEPDRGLSFLRLYSSGNVARVLKASYKLTPGGLDDHWRAAQK